jgi:hypothetical protein
MNKKNLPLYIALAVPVLMILLVAAFIYFPGIGKHPKHNFLYLSGNDVYYYGSGQGYQVSGGHLVFNPPSAASAPSYYAQQGQPHFYIYDVAKNEATEVSLAEAQSYTLDPTNTSSDGYTIQQGNGGGSDFLFGGGGGDYTSWFIKGNNRAIKLNLKLTGSSYSNFRFLGWIE